MPIPVHNVTPIPEISSHSMQRALCCALVVLVCVTTSSPVPGSIDEDSAKMAIVPFPEAVASDPVSAELVNGALAQDVSEELQKGPRVNGGFALNILPRNSGEKLVANADCAGSCA